VSHEQNFDARKLKEQVRDSAKRFRDALHEQIHRDIHERLECVDPGRGSRGRPMVIGIALHGRGRGGMITGAIFVLAGLAFLLDHLGVVSIGNPWRFWPLLLVLGGVLNFVSQRRGWGIFWMLTGILLQLNSLNIMHFDWSVFWPLMVMALGLSILWGSFQWGNKPAAFPPHTADPRTTLSEAVVFGGLERRMSSQDFQGGDISAIFGGVDLDLTQANMVGNEATLSITAIFGGVELRVPPNWQIAFRGSPIFGGVEDKTRAAQADDPSSPNRKVLVITGAVIFGGVEIKN